jgi:hypothetical protein
MILFYSIYIIGTILGYYLSKYIYMSDFPNRKWSWFEIFLTLLFNLSCWFVIIPCGMAGICIRLFVKYLPKNPPRWL